MECGHSSSTLKDEASRERGFTVGPGSDTLRCVKATNWEFANRAMVFGLIFGFTFPLYALDQQNSTAALANWLAPKLQLNADPLARLLFALAAVLLMAAAFIRTWASSYLQASVVYASEVKSASLIADGPYRYVRNPLYFANVLMIIAMGAMMSGLGFFVAVAAMLVFCYRLIFREEAGLAGQHEVNSSRNIAGRCRVCGLCRGRASLPLDGEKSGARDSRRNRGTGDLRRR